MIVCAQVNSFSCGAVAAAGVVRTFFPDTRFEEVYAAVEPDEVMGTSRARLVRVLRRFGITARVRRRTCVRELVAHLRKRQPAIVAIQNPGCEVGHWVNAIGCGTRHIVLAVNGLPWLNKKRYTRAEFETRWRPERCAIFCSVPKRRLRMHQGPAPSGMTLNTCRHHSVAWQK